MYRSYCWRRGHFLNLYAQSPEWRFLSSWDRPNGASRNINERHANTGKEETQDHDWYGEWRKRHAESLKHFEEFKRMIDEDPYGAIFGRRLTPRNQERVTKLTPGASNSTTHGATQHAGNAGVNTVETKHAGEPTSTPKPSTRFDDDVPKADRAEDFTIDPITMRKILKRPSPLLAQEALPKDGPNARSWSSNIPVKPYKAPQQASQPLESKENVPPAVRKLGKEGQAWLAQEASSTASKSAEAAGLQATRTSKKIESALDRHLKKEKHRAAIDRNDKAALDYDPQDIKTDDVDLLTASDIRGSVGRTNGTSKQTPQEKQERREILENDYLERSGKIEKRLEAEIAASEEQSQKDLMQELQDIAKAVRKRDAAKNAHELEVKAQKVAMEAHEARRTNIKKTSATPSNHKVQPGEGDMAHNVHEFANRDRWYKQKAPHASAEAESKLRQTNKDKALLREIRGIYEDSYGIIDTKHRQQPPKQPEEVSGYPSDAYPGTLYEQPWSANVLNDHPEIDSQSGNSVIRSELQGLQEQQEFQALSLIGRLFSEFRENQTLLQDHHAELRKIPTRDESTNLYQSLKAHEQRVMHTLKAAQSLIKAAAVHASDAHTKTPSETAVIPQEEAASTIAAPMKQDNKQAPKTDQPRPASSTVYKILAYDLSTKKITTTKTTKLVEPLAGRPLSLSEALSGLENPAKFLPHFAALQSAGYETAAGGPNFLVFRKTRQPHPQAELEDGPTEPTRSSGDIPFRYANPIDGTTTQTGNFASPTGFVNYDPPYLVEETPNNPSLTAESHAWKSKPRDRVSRQEDVFSGSSRRAWQDQHDNHRTKAKTKDRRTTRRRRTFKRMFLVGLLTAGGCYAVGVASEILRM